MTFHLCKCTNNGPTLIPITLGIAYMDTLLPGIPFFAEFFMDSNQETVNNFTTCHLMRTSLHLNTFKHQCHTCKNRLTHSDAYTGHKKTISHNLLLFYT